MRTFVTEIVLLQKIKVEIKPGIRLWIGGQCLLALLDYFRCNILVIVNSFMNISGIYYSTIAQWAAETCLKSHVFD